jgi:hypothetical protein
VSKCVGIFPIIFTNVALRADECADIKISVNKALNLSAITMFFVMAAELISGILQPLSKFGYPGELVIKELLV